AGMSHDAGAAAPDLGATGVVVADAGQPPAGHDAGADAIAHCTVATIMEPCASCRRANCNPEVSACFGANWFSQDFRGGKCEALFQCICSGSSSCPNPDSQCIACLATAKTCQTSHCLGLCQ